MTAVPVNRMFVFGFTSVAMLAGFIVTALLSIPMRGGADTLPAAWGWLLLPVPGLFAAAAFSFVSSGSDSSRLRAALAVLLAGVAFTLLAAPFAGLILILAPLLTAGAAVLATRLLRPA